LRKLRKGGIVDGDWLMVDGGEEARVPLASLRSKVWGRFSGVIIRAVRIGLGNVMVIRYISDAGAIEMIVGIILQTESNFFL
jgi:hypothetical protein